MAQPRQAEASVDSGTEGFVTELEQEVTELENMSQPEEQQLIAVMSKLRDAKLRGLQQNAVDVSLDPATANSLLVLSEDGKQVQKGDTRRNLPDSPERFSVCFGVLGKQSFSAGRFYYEVEVKGKTFWRVGVALKSVKRKDRITLCPTNGFWTICVINGDECYAGADQPVQLAFRGLQKVGVFVDYEEGLVSFYDVEHKRNIYSFTGCCFTEAMYPYFGPNSNDGEKSSPLIITPVIQKN